MHRYAALLAWVPFVLGSISAPSLVSAQRRVQYDELAEMTPATVSCGFCAGERFGVVFRQLSSGGGLQPSSFPLTVESLEIALASVRVEAMDIGGFPIYQCVGATEGGPVDTLVELYAGMTPPSGDIQSLPATGPWPDEELVWSDTVPPGSARQGGV